MVIKTENFLKMEIKQKTDLIEKGSYWVEYKFKLLELKRKKSSADY